MRRGGVLRRLGRDESRGIEKVDRRAIECDGDRRGTRLILGDARERHVDQLLVALVHARW